MSLRRARDEPSRFFTPFALDGCRIGGRARRRALRGARRDGGPAPRAVPTGPPPVPEIPHLILGSLRYTLAWDVAASAFLLLVWFFGGRLESYWLSFATGDAATPTTSPRRPRRRDATPPPRRRNARLRQLLAVWRASEEEVTSLCGADARITSSCSVCCS